MPEAGDQPTISENQPREVDVYGMRLADLTPERMGDILGIYHDIVNPSSDLVSLTRAISAEEVVGKIKGNKYEDLEFRVGSSERAMAKFRIVGRHTLVDGEEVIDFSYDSNNPTSTIDEKPNPLEEEFDKAVKKYLVEKGLSVPAPQDREEDQDIATRFRLRREYMANKR